MQEKSRSMHLINQIVKTCSLPVWESDVAISSLLLEAKKHGIELGSWENLRFESWLISDSPSFPSYDGNLVKIELDQDAIYIAKVVPVLNEEEFLVAFQTRPDFEIGEQWRYVLDIEYIGRIGTNDTDRTVFDLDDISAKNFEIVVRPGLNAYDVSLPTGMDIEFLHPDLSHPLHALVDLLALRAEDCDGALKWTVDSSSRFHAGSTGPHAGH